MPVVGIVADRIAPYTGKIVAVDMPVVQDTVGTATDIAAVGGTATGRSHQTYCLFADHMQH